MNFEFAMFPPGVWSDLFKVIAIDVMLAGDNVVILGALAAGLPAQDRTKVIRIGVAISLVFLIGLAFLATAMLKIVGVLLAGGFLLLWVAWKLYRELTHKPRESGSGTTRTPKSFRQTVINVVIADLSMSLDNVLAVAGAARDHPAVLFIGLALSVTLMGIAASLIARVIERHRWIAFVGLGVVIWVAFGMIIEGGRDVHHVVAPMIRF